MKVLKNLCLIIFCLLLFTGCTVDYNITFKSDYTIDENIIISESNEVLENSGYTIEDIIDGKLSSYSDDIINYGFSVKRDIGSEKTKVKLSSKNKEISTFLKFPYFTRMFNGADIEDDLKNYSFKTNGSYNQSGLFYDLSGIVDEGFVDQLNINIKFEDKVLSTNADSYDKKTNTYTWTLDKDTSEKSIEFKLKKNDLKKKKNSKNTDFKMVIILTGIVVSLIAIISIYVLILNKNRNKL